MYLRNIQRISLIEAYPKVRAGDREAKNQMIESLIPLAMNLLKGRQKKNDDLLEEMFVALVDGVELISEGTIDHHDPVTEGSICAYMTLYVGYRIQRADYNKKPRFPGYKINRGHPDTTLDVREILERFTGVKSLVIEGLMLGKNGAEIGRELGLTRQRIGQIREEIKNDYLRMVQPSSRAASLQVVNVEGRGKESEHRC